MKKIMKTLDLNSISRFWFQPTDTLFDFFKDSVLDRDDPDKRRIFIDNGGSVLLVAHLDTIQTPLIKQFKNGRIYAQGLDDRLGAYIGYKLATMLGMDLLLCDLEESGQSTAQYHDMQNKYNWVCELDRGGDDVVTYDLDSKEFHDKLDNFWAVGYGTFSDIAFLDTNVCCFNLGIGVEKSHEKGSYAVLSTMNRNVQLFLDFYELYKDTKFDYDGSNLKQRQYDYGFGDRYNYHNANYDYDWMCEICGLDYGEDVFDKCICERCFKHMYQDAVGV